MKDRFCEKCGTPLIPNANFCDECGAKVNQENENEIEQEAEQTENAVWREDYKELKPRHYRRGRKVISTMVASLCLLFILFVGHWYFGEREKNETNQEEVAVKESLSDESIQIV